MTAMFARFALVSLIISLLVGCDEHTVCVDDSVCIDMCIELGHPAANARCEHGACVCAEPRDADTPDPGLSDAAAADAPEGSGDSAHDAVQ